MSEIGQGQQEHHRSIELSFNNPVSISSTTVPFANDRSPPNRNPRLGELFVDVPLDAGLLKGGIAPFKFHHLWCKYQAKLLIQKGTKRSNESDNDAIELYFAAQKATEKGPVLSFWEASVIEQVVTILERHPVFKERDIDTSQVVERLLQQNPRKILFAAMDSIQSNQETGSNMLGALASGLSNNGLFSDGSDSSAGISKILQDIGPACTRNAMTFRETLAEITATSPTGVNESALARIIHFFSDKGRGSDGSSLIGVSSALLGSLIPGRGNEMSVDGWNIRTVIEVLEQDYTSREWAMVAKCWDFPGFVLKDLEQFLSLMDLFRAGARANPPLTALTSQWRNTAGQLSILECIVTGRQDIFPVPLNEAESEDAATSAPGVAGIDPKCFASMEILQRLLFLSDVPSLYRRVRDLFVKGLLGCPEVLLCALVRLQLQVANTPPQAGRDALASAGLQIKTELMRELIPLFFRPTSHHRVQNAPGALRRLYAISPNTVTAACFEAWRSTVGDSPQLRVATLVHIINIARLLPNPADAVASLLNGSKDPEFSVAIAFVMADNEYLQLKPWLVEKLSNKSTITIFAPSIISYIAKTHSASRPRGSEPTPLVSLENIAITMQLMQSLDASILSQPFSNADGRQMQDTTLGDNVKAVTEACIAAHPNLRSSLSTKNTSNGGGTNAAASISSGASDDVEEMATAYFQKIYTSEQSIGEVVEMLKRFKTSGNTKENEIFACMVHNLFDEYRFFSKYPEKELRITGILFGTLIQEQLVSSITLGIALRYVLEALRKQPSPPGSTTSSGKMFQFGMFALEQFKGRLHEWPQYCSHIVQIPHLREGYAELVSEIETAMQESQSRTAAGTPPATTNDQNGSATAVTPREASGVSATHSTSSSASSLELPAPIIPVDSKPRVAEFGPLLGRAVTDEEDDRDPEAPPDKLLDRIQFLINNLAPSNVESKSQELKELLEPKYFDWLAHYLVVKRISTQANYHSLYLNFLDNLGEYGKGLVEAILDSAYRNIGKLLRSPKITTSSSERSYLKNLGIWLGQITLARNRPILQIMLDCKELLLQGYETGKLIAVAPFLSKTLEGAKNSIVFRPPNPWLMGLLGVFRSVYNVEGLKMNIKFEVEVLCKNLGVRLEDIPIKDKELAKRVAPVKERNPDFNIKAAAVKSSSIIPSSGVAGTPDAKGLSIPTAGEGARHNVSGDEEATVIPNLAAYVAVNQSLTQLLQQSGQSGPLATLNNAALKRAVPIAVDRAIREIIQPVVERSVTIACITTKEIVAKDFAMESDENKMRKAGQLMVANLAGSLALVTCREPLRSSVSTHLRQILTANATGSGEKLNEQDQNVIEQCVQICATDNLELGCMLIEKAATEKAVRDVDEAIAQHLNARRKHREQTGQPFYDMSIFGNNQRYPAGLPDQLRPKPGGIRPEIFQLYDNFQRMPRQSQAPGGMVSSSAIAPRQGSSEGDMQQGTQKPLGIDALSALATKLDSAVSTLLNSAGARAPEVKLQMLPPDHQISQLLGAVNQILPNISPAGEISRNLSQTEQDAVLGFSQSIFKRLYELNLGEPLRLEALVALLEKINVSCPKLGRDMGTWATYAPTNTEQQRRLHRTVLLLLIRSRLLAVNELDQFLAARADNGRNPVWVEFALLFIRTAFLERIASPSDFPKVIDLMTRIVDGRSQAGAQIIQAYRKPILRMLEEMRGLTQAGASQAQSSARQTGSTPPPISTTDQRRSGAVIQESSSLSPLSLSTYSTASRKVAEATEAFSLKDPPNAKQQVTQLLENWIRVDNEASGNEKINAQFLQYLQQYSVGKVEEHTERFIRLSTLIVVDAVAKTATSGTNGRSLLNYAVSDVYCKLLMLMFKNLNSGGSADQINIQRLAMLNKILGCTVRTMMWDIEKTKARGGPWDQRPWYRILMNLVIDVNKPDPELESIRLGLLSVFAAAFHVAQPLVVPSFSFSWFELVSHRHFLPNLLLVEGQKGWNTAHQLLIDYLLFLEPYMNIGEMTPPVKKLYEGTLRVFLVLLHDFPSFLAGYYLSFCNVIPATCLQLRNLILSASPKGMNPPDPFTPNLKIDLLPEISQAPVILSNVVGPIEGFRTHLDSFLKDGLRRDFLSALPSLLTKESSAEIDFPKVSSLVLYVGIHALARLQNTQISLSRTPEMEVLQTLMEFDDKGRYHCLNAIANQLRYPSSHTHYFSCVMLYIFSESKNVAVKEQVTRVLLERLILHRPHPWGLLITFIELIKNQRYGFWNYPFTRCAAEIEKVFESVARSVMSPGSISAGGEE
ncbi:CCR4-Not complex component, Not1 [Nitzschia inconspicua]|uniref:CCR4-Not complex component, Not1 n=1 Tax=Nitzschia inconspicua TaxID=303405 RepID=A0A9K3PJF6_9STRA|nr:CCR4-Not complex component, Not1 [Nitzschia inconspicua]